MYFDYINIGLFGHRDFSEHRRLEEKLIPVLKELLLRKTFVEIYLGRDGEFDIYVASLIKQFQHYCDDEKKISMNLVMPYRKGDMDAYEKYYDQILIPITTHPKLAITKRNEWIVDNSNLILCYVQPKFGGAYRAMRYAERTGKTVMNLADIKTIEHNNQDVVTDTK